MKNYLLIGGFVGVIYWYYSNSEFVSRLVIPLQGNSFFGAIDEIFTLPATFLYAVVITGLENVGGFVIINIFSYLFAFAIGACLGYCVFRLRKG